MITCTLYIQRHCTTKVMYIFLLPHKCHLSAKSLYPLCITQMLLQDTVIRRMINLKKLRFICLSSSQLRNVTKNVLLEGIRVHDINYSFFRNLAAYRIVTNLPLESLFSKFNFQDVSFFYISPYKRVFVRCIYGIFIASSRL